MVKISREVFTPSIGASAKASIARNFAPASIKRMIDTNMAKLNTDPVLKQSLKEAAARRGALDNSALVTFQNVGRFGFVLKEGDLIFVPDSEISEKLLRPTTVCWFSEEATRNLLEDMILKQDLRRQMRAEGKPESEIALKGIETPQRDFSRPRDPVPPGTPREHFWVGPAGSDKAFIHICTISALFNDLIDAMDFSAVR